MINIRRAQLNDYEAVARIYAWPKAMAGTLQLPYSNPEIWRSRLEGDGMYNLVAEVDDEIVGHIGLTTFATPRRKHAGAIGMAVRDDCQGQGIGSALMQAVTELADNWLNLSRLELEVYTDNEAALHLYKKFGFEIEGVKKLYAFRDGRYVDVYAMGRLRSIMEND